MNAFDLSPLLRTAIGFDRMARLADTARAAADGPAYPPYNIERVSDDGYVLTMAVAGFGPDDIEREMREYAGRQRDGEVGPVKSQTINGREWIGIDVAFVDEQAGTIAQLHWFTAQQQNDVVDVLQATASFAASRKESDYPVLDALVDSIRVNP